MPNDLKNCGIEFLRELLKRLGHEKAEHMKAQRHEEYMHAMTLYGKVYNAIERMQRNNLSVVI